MAWTRPGGSLSHNRPVLEIRGLSVAIASRRILHDVSLTVRENEVHVLFGPNGSGKTTLLRAIMGFPQGRVESGAILFRGDDMTGLSLDERARRGIGISLQRPPTLRGVTLRRVLEAFSPDPEDMVSLAREYGLEGFLDRCVNAGFSGGESKRAELLQLMAQGPELVLLDEPESGVDRKSMGRVGRMINRLLGRDVCGPGAQRVSSARLIISHTGGILDFVAADWGHVLCEGRLYCTQRPAVILDRVRREGYEACVTCEA